MKIKLTANEMCVCMVAAVKITSDKGDLLESKGHYNETSFMTYLAELAESIGSEWAVAKYFGLPFDPFEDNNPRIRMLNPFGTYPELDRYGRVLSVTQVIITDAETLAAQYPEY